MENIIEMLKNNSYPGRGIMIGQLSPNRIRIYYFIMGRSENSRNRVFAYTDDGIRTEAFDPSKLQDPSLIIYHPVRFFKDKVIVTNGDQTDTIRDFLAEGKSFQQALATREYEPDAPNFTPRISAIVNEDASFELSILLSDGNGGCERRFWKYSDVPYRSAYFISTYKCDGAPLPSFDTDPIEVPMPEPEDLWAALNQDNKVSLYACDVELKAGEKLQTIYNKLLGD